MRLLAPACLVGWCEVRNWRKGTPPRVGGADQLAPGQSNHDSPKPVLSSSQARVAGTLCALHGPAGCLTACCSSCVMCAMSARQRSSDAAKHGWAGGSAAGQGAGAGGRSDRRAQAGIQSRIPTQTPGDRHLGSDQRQRHVTGIQRTGSATLIDTSARYGAATMRCMAAAEWAPTALLCVCRAAVLPCCRAVAGEQRGAHAHSTSMRMPAGAGAMDPPWT